MSLDRRYSVQHLGDLFVEALSSVTNSARQHARDVVVAYDVRALRKKRAQVLAMIGTRIAQARRAGLVDLRRDDKLVEMMDDVAQIDRAIATVAERASRGAQHCGGGGTSCCQDRAACGSCAPAETTAASDPS